ncbi:methyl-accepting chemotaxis protein [Cohnella sp. CFH 77786]|uniref:methyl-accepting chemotaxis protein n=1 Tax=Cohnella sp. CFH 77786 TaxID=2662265 RepID=UPI001C610F89|nr:methyl-accepting chemotaxis protein [Cohnella sp. CFH 77786]
MKLKYKTFTLIAVGLIMLFIVAGVGYYNISRMAKSAKSMYENSMQVVISTGKMRTNTQAVATAEMDIIISSDKKRIQTLLEKVSSLIAANENEIKFIQGANLDEKQRELFDIYVQKLRAYQPVETQIRKLGAVGTESLNAQAYALYVNKGYAMLSDLNNAINDFMDYSLQSAKDINDRNQNNAAIATKIMIAVAVIAIALLSLIGIAITNMITRPVKKLQELMARAAQGDLTVQGEFNAKDEIGQLNLYFNGMIDGFKDTVAKIFAAADSVSAAAEEISATTQEIASNGNEQALSAQAMNEMVGELSEAVGSVAQSAEQASHLSDRTAAIAQEGTKVVEDSIGSMDRLKDQMTRLEEDSNKIGEIIEVIDDIADQTNLLALNAAIEAARAGDQGRGFAVVADEVRKLAERSGEATKQITTIIKTMQTNMMQSVRAVDEGVTVSRQSGEAFKSIAAMVGDTNAKVSEIAAATEQQSAQTANVLRSIETISTATEESAASSEETAAAAQSLAHLAEELNSTVAAFKIK